MAKMGPFDLVVDFPNADETQGYLDWLKEFREESNNVVLSVEESMVAK